MIDYKMIYSMQVREVKRVIDAKLNKRPYDEAQFLYYHLNRNYFNVKNEVTSLRKQGEAGYVDNLGNTWQEVSSLKNYYHMPFGNWVGSNLGVTTPYSRKFLRNDNSSGLFGEFEMIIRHDGKRIDALTNSEYQETYNFGRTQNFSAHKLLDVDTHNQHSNYAFRRDMGSVVITE